MEKLCPTVDFIILFVEVIVFSVCTVAIQILTEGTDTFELQLKEDSHQHSCHTPAPLLLVECHLL